MAARVRFATAILARSPWVPVAVALALGAALLWLGTPEPTPPAPPRSPVRSLPARALDDLAPLEAKVAAMAAFDGAPGAVQSTFEAWRAARRAATAPGGPDAHGGVPVERAAFVLGFLEALGPEAVPGLALAVHDPHPPLAVRALEALGKLGGRAAAALPDVRAVLRAGDPRVTPVAAATVLAIAGEDPEALREVEALTTSRDPYDRKQAVVLVEGLGARGRAAWPLLLPLLRDAREIPVASAREPVPDRVAWLAADALTALEAKALAPDLVELVRGDDATARRAAALVLLGLDVPFEEAPAVLEEILREAPERRGTGWLDAEAARHAGDLHLGWVPDGLFDALVGRLPSPRGPAAARALLTLGERGRARAEALLVGEGGAVARAAVLTALEEDPPLARGLEAALGRVAERDESAWNRDAAREVLRALDRSRDR